MAIPDAQRNRLPVYALLVANLISQIGNQFTLLAIPWFVLETTGSASSAGITVAVGALPYVLAGIFGGPIVDRLGYKRSSIVSDLASGITVLLIPLLQMTSGLAFWQLLVLVFLGALLDSPGASARRSLFPELAERAGMQLERANAGYQTVRRIAGLLSPPLAGLLIAVVGAANVLWIDAVTFAASAGIVALGVRVPAAVQDEPAVEGAWLQRYTSDIRAGFGYLYRDKLLLGIALTSSLGMLVAEPLYAVILPVYANEVFGSVVDLGLTFAALAAGSVIGNGVFALLSQRLSRRVLYIGGYAVRAVAFAVLLTVPPWWVVAIAIFIGAVALEPINPLMMTVFQERVPGGMRGRVFGASAALQAMSFPVGIVVYGYLLERFGVERTMEIFVAVNVLVPLMALAVPAIRTMTRPEPALATSRARTAE